MDILIDLILFVSQGLSLVWFGLFTFVLFASFLAELNMIKRYNFVDFDKGIYFVKQNNLKWIFKGAGANL